MAEINKICEIEGCNLEKYDERHCILHAYDDEKDSKLFEEELIKHINSQLTQNNSLLEFNEIYFPANLERISLCNFQTILKELILTIIFKNCFINCCFIFDQNTNVIFNTCIFNITITNESINWNINYYNFKDCLFMKEIYLHSLEISTNIEFLCCRYIYIEIIKSIFHENFIFKELINVDIPTDASFNKFKEVTFNKSFYFDSNEGNFVFEGNCNFNGYSYFRNKPYIEQVIEFDQTKFNSKTHFEGWHESVKFKHIYLNGHIFFNNSSLKIENFIDSPIREMKFNNIEWVDLKTSFEKMIIGKIWDIVTFPINNYKSISELKTLITTQKYDDDYIRQNCKQLINYYIENRDFETAENLYVMDMNLTFLRTNIFYKAALFIYYVLFGYGVKPIHIFIVFFIFNACFFPYFYCHEHFCNDGSNFLDGLYTSFKVLTLQLEPENYSKDNLLPLVIGLQKLLGYPLLILFFLSIRRKFKI